MSGAIPRRGSLVPPPQAMEDRKRLDTWLECLAIRERWDAWEAEEIAAGRIKDTRTNRESRSEFLADSTILD